MMFKQENNDADMSLKCIILPLKYYKRQDFGGMHKTAKVMSNGNNKLKHESNT